MAHNDELIMALRDLLRKKRITYAHLASKLELSESSLKRNFSQRDMSLSRLSKICDIASLELIDLVNHVEQKRNRVSQFTEQQEIALTQDIRLLMTAYFLSVGEKFDDIVANYAIDEAEGIQILTQLDRIGILELLPNNHVRILFDRNFSWRPHGPIANFFETHIQSEFFKSTFSENNEIRVVCNGNLTQASLEECHTKLTRLKREIDLLIDKESRIPNKLKQGITMIAAFRPWKPAIFSQLEKTSVQ